MVRKLMSAVGKVAGPAGLSFAPLPVVLLVAALAAAVVVVVSVVLLSAAFNDKVQQRVADLVRAWRGLPPDPPALFGGPSP